MTEKTTMMQREIFSEPEVLKRTIAACRPVQKKIKEEFEKRNISKIVTMSRGSSDNASTVFSFVCPLYAGKLVGKYHPSLTTVYGADTDMSNTCMVVVSQSGMSKDTVAVMEDAKARGALTIGVTNDENSTVAKGCDIHMFLDVDEEKSVAATKTYIAELIALYMLTECVGKQPDMCVDKIVDKIPSVLALNDKIADVAAALAPRNNFIILSRGTMLGTGDECALKLTECCYMFNRSYSSANFMHGPLSLLAEGANVIMLAPDGKFNDEFISMAQRVRDAGASLTAFSDIPEVLDLAEQKIEMPKGCDKCNPVLYGTAVSLLALNIGGAKGLNVDAPRNLKKVTVTL